MSAGQARRRKTDRKLPPERFVRHLFAPDPTLVILRGGRVRKKNKAEDRVDRRLKEIQNPDRLCALAIHGRAPGSLTFTRVIRNEDSEPPWAAVRDHVSRKVTVHADEHSSYDDLLGLNRMKRVNHSKTYSTEDGDNTNFVESFFSRIERSYREVHHRHLGEAEKGRSKRCRDQPFIPELDNRCGW